MELYCVICYKSATGKCNKCKRPYCGADCQKIDWKRFGHKTFCGEYGENGKDFEIRDSPGKQGVGVFALRKFRFGEKIMLERRFDITNGANLVPERLIQKLIGDTVERKVKLNEINEESLSLGLCKVNNDCIGNAAVVKISAELDSVRAIRDISAGEEITRPYIDEYLVEFTEAAVFGKQSGREKRQKRLLEQYGFICKCSACADAEVDAKLLSLQSLYDECLQLLYEPNDIAALLKSRQLIENAESLKYDPNCTFDSYIINFTAMMRLRRPLQEVYQTVKKAHEHAKIWFGPGTFEVAHTLEMRKDPMSFYIRMISLPEKMHTILAGTSDYMAASGDFDQLMFPVAKP